MSRDAMREELASLVAPEPGASLLERRSRHSQRSSIAASTSSPRVTLATSIVVVAEDVDEVGLVQRARRRACGSTRGHGTAAAAAPGESRKVDASFAARRRPSRRAGAAAAARDRDRATPSSQSRRSGRSCSITRDVRLNPRVSSRERGAGPAGVAEPERREPLLRGVGGDGDRRPRACRAAGRRRASRGSPGPRLVRSVVRVEGVERRSGPGDRGSRGRGRVGCGPPGSVGRVCVCCSSQSWSRCSTVRRNRYASARARRPRTRRSPPSASLLERVERVRGADRLVVATMDELQELDRELDVADPAAAALQLAVVETLPAPSRLRRAPSSPAPRGPRRGRGPSGQTWRPAVSMKRRAELVVAGDGPGLDEGLELPGLGPPVVPGRVRVEAPGQRPGASLGAEVGVGPEHDAVGGRLGHHRQHRPARRARPRRRRSPSWTNRTSTSLA